MTAALRRRRLVALVLLVELLIMLDYQVGPAICSPEEHSAVTR